MFTQSQALSEEENAFVWKSLANLVEVRGSFFFNQIFEINFQNFIDKMHDSCPGLHLRSYQNEKLDALVNRRLVFREAL